MFWTLCICWGRGVLDVFWDWKYEEIWRTYILFQSFKLHSAYLNIFKNEYGYLNIINDKKMLKWSNFPKYTSNKVNVSTVNCLIKFLVYQWNPRHLQRSRVVYFFCLHNEVRVLSNILSITIIRSFYSDKKWCAQRFIDFTDEVHIEDEIIINEAAFWFGIRFTDK